MTSGAMQGVVHSCIVNKWWQGDDTDREASSTALRAWPSRGDALLMCMLHAVACMRTVYVHAYKSVPKGKMPPPRQAAVLGKNTQGYQWAVHDVRQLCRVLSGHVHRARRTVQRMQYLNTCNQTLLNLPNVMRPSARLWCAGHARHAGMRMAACTRKATTAQDASTNH